MTILAPGQPSMPFAKFSPTIPPGAWPCFVLVSLGTLPAPVFRPLQSQFYHPLASVPSPGPGQLRKSYLPRNGFWEALA